MNHSSEVYVHHVKEVKYVIETKAFLEMKVNAAIKEGWELAGPPVYAGRDDDVPYLIQMMVKR